MTERASEGFLRGMNAIFLPFFGERPNTAGGTESRSRKVVAPGSEYAIRSSAYPDTTNTPLMSPPDDVGIRAPGDVKTE